MGHGGAATLPPVVPAQEEGGVASALVVMDDVAGVLHFDSAVLFSSFALPVRLCFSFPCRHTPNLLAASRAPAHGIVDAQHGPRAISSAIRTGRALISVDWLLVTFQSHLPRLVSIQAQQSLIEPTPAPPSIQSIQSTRILRRVTQRHQRHTTGTSGGAFARYTACSAPPPHLQLSHPTGCWAQTGRRACDKRSEATEPKGPFRLAPYSSLRPLDWLADWRGRRLRTTPNALSRIVVWCRPNTTRASLGAEQRPWPSVHESILYMLCIQGHSAISASCLAACHC